MNHAARLGLLLFLFLVAVSGLAVDSVRLNNRPYINLDIWAQSHGFTLRWTKTNERLTLTSSTARMEFVVDSCEMRLNDVQVFLLYPLANRGGAPWIAQPDLEETLDPLLNPTPNRSKGKIKTICLDPGHGGKDPGNRINGREEKDYTLRLAFELREQLKQEGYTVVLTRSGDTFVDLPLRPDYAHTRSADLFVSLHFNATDAGRDEAHGSEVYCLTPAGASSTNARGEGGNAKASPGNRLNAKNLLLAYQVQKSLVGTLAAPDRGVRRARFAVLRDASAPAILIEAGFMSHPVEGKKIFDPVYRRDIAKAIVKGIKAYASIVQR